MRYFGVILLLCLNLLADPNYQKLVDSISEYAIRIGNGANRVYAFVDPLCSKSKRYLELIDDNDDLQQKSTYYIFLHRLQRFDSDRHIQYIYQSPDKLEALKDIMIYEDFDELEGFKVTGTTLKTIEKVSKVAKKFKMKRRPYLLIFNEGVPYCTVSEGTAPCMQRHASH